MHTRTKTAAIALTGAVALASGAYALGTQVGGGAAVADEPGDELVIAADPSDRDRPLFRAHFRGGPLGSDRLADRLGVDESDLRDALEDARSQLPDPGEVRRDFGAQLAKELGISEDRVDAALERMRERTEREFEQRRDELAERLADRLNLDVDKVKDALGDFPFLGHVRPPGPPPGP
jgi:Clp amino terminal domain, pathogenicity island component